MIERHKSEMTSGSGRAGRTGALLQTRRSVLALAAAGAVLLASCGSASGVGDDVTGTTTPDVVSPLIGPPVPDDVVCLGPPVPDDVVCLGPPVPADVVSLLVSLPVPDADVESAFIGPPFAVAVAEVEVIDP